jgi:branched-chain amino acid transport system substrate-binding protein
MIGIVDRRAWGAGVLVFLASLALLLHPAHAMTSASSAPPVIRIGEINPLTGKLARHGIEIHEGILWAVEVVNARGGILGRKIELVSRDDQSLPEVAINQAEDLLYRNRVIGLVGGYVDSLVGPVSELAARYGVPYVASASLQRSLTLGRKNPFFFRVAHLDGIVVPLCDFIRDVVRPTSVAILYTSTPGSTELGQEVESRLKESGVPLGLVEKFRPGSPDFSAFLLKLRAARVDTLICGGFFPDHLVLVRQIREQKIALKAYVGPWGVAYPSFIEEMGAAAEGLFGMCAWSGGITPPGTEDASRAFMEGFEGRFGKAPNTTTMHGYASAAALLAAVEQDLQSGGSLKGQDTGRRLRELDLLTPMGRVAFDERGDPRHYRQVVVQIQGGNLVAVFPKDRAGWGIRWPSP